MREDTKTILLSGVNGFLGANLAQALMRDYNIIGLKRSSSDTSRISHLNIKLYDIDKIPLVSIFNKHKIDIIIHTATCYGRRGEALSTLLESNLLFSVRLLELAESFDIEAFFNTDTLQYDYLSNYTISKKTLRDYLPHFSKLKIINCKLEHMYGYGDDNAKFVAYLLECFSANKPLIPLSKGTQLRDFIYIDDVVGAYLVLLEHRQSLNKLSHFDIGTGEMISVREFVSYLLQVFKRYQRCDSRLDFGALKLKSRAIKEDISPLRSLGFKAKYDYKEGIEYLVNRIFTSRGGVARESNLIPESLGAFIFGYAFHGFANFWEFTDLKSSSPPKISKNLESHTANIRMLLCGMESLDSGVESALDSRDSKDSKLRLESNKIDSVCGTHPKEASSGERESVREGEGSDFAIQAPSPSLKNGSLEKGSLVEDSKELKDSNVESPLDSRILNKYSNFKSNLDSRISILPPSIPIFAVWLSMFLEDFGSETRLMVCELPKSSKSFKCIPKDEYSKDSKSHIMLKEVA